MFWEYSPSSTSLASDTMVESKESSLVHEEERKIKTRAWVQESARTSSLTDREPTQPYGGYSSALRFEPVPILNTA